MRNPLLNCIRDAIDGASFKCLLSGNNIKLVGYCFVDDSTIIQVPPLPTTSTEEIKRAEQKGLDMFYGEAQATGGNISVQK